jgi:hypothetical protein
MKLTQVQATLWDSQWMLQSLAQYTRQPPRCGSRTHRDDHFTSCYCRSFTALITTQLRGRIASLGSAASTPKLDFRLECRCTRAAFDSQIFSIVFTYWALLVCLCEMSESDPSTGETRCHCTDSDTVPAAIITSAIMRMTLRASIRLSHFHSISMRILKIPQVTAHILYFSLTEALYVESILPHAHVPQARMNN